MEINKWNKAKTKYKTALPQAKGYVKSASKMSKAGKVLGKVAGKVAGPVAVGISAYQAGKKVKQAGESAWGYLKQRKETKASQKKAKSMKKKLVNNTAKRNYTAIRGEKAYNKSQDQGSFLNKDRKDINKMKKNISKNRYGYL